MLSLLLASIAAAPLAMQDLAVQTVVATVAEVAQENAELPEAERARGDALAELYIRRACESGQPADAIVLGLACALEPSGIMADAPLAGSRLKGVETSAHRKQRLAAMGHPTLRGREDWLAHFVVSAGLAVTTGEAAAALVGIQKELSDAAGKEQGKGSGFSFTDLNADFAGIAFARWLAGSSSRDALAVASRSYAGEDFVPDPAGLADGLTWTEFEAAWGGVDDPRFRQQCERLRSNVAACRGYAMPTTGRDAQPAAPQDARPAAPQDAQPAEPGDAPSPAAEVINQVPLASDSPKLRMAESVREHAAGRPLIADGHMLYNIPIESRSGVVRPASGRHDMFRFMHRSTVTAAFVALLVSCGPGPSSRELPPAGAAAVVPAVVQAPEIPRRFHAYEVLRQDDGSGTVMLLDSTRADEGAGARLAVRLYGDVPASDAESVVNLIFAARPESEIGELTSISSEKPSSWSVWTQTTHNGDGCEAGLIISIVRESDMLRIASATPWVS